MASTDARPVPKKNTAYRHYFAIRKNDGTLITTWAGQDSERSLDGATYADCTNEATEIGATGTGYIDLTATEMDTDATVLKVTVTNTDALPYVVTLFPEDAGDIRANATQVGGQTTSASGTVTFPAATLASTTNITAATGVVLSSAGVAAIWNALTSGMTTANSIGKKLADWVLYRINWADIQNKTTVNALTNTTVKSDPNTVGLSGFQPVEVRAYTSGTTLPANGINADSIAANALNGKGDWNTVTPDAAGTAATLHGTTDASVAALNDLAAADVLTQVNAALDTAIAELGVAQPTATPTVRTGLMLMYMALRNQTITQTSGTDALEIYNDAGTKIASKALTDDGSDYTEAKMVSG